MPKFRAAHTVEAEQWFPGKPVEGVVDRCQAEIHYSELGDFYYITKGALRPSRWLSMAKTEGQVPEEKQKAADNIFAPGYAEIFIPSTGERYWRTSYDFAFWKVRSGPTKPIDEKDDLFIDYAVTERWKPEDIAAAGQGAWLLGHFGDPQFQLRPGDWIVTHPNGHKALVRAEQFAATYQPEAIP